MVLLVIVYMYTMVYWPRAARIGLFWAPVPVALLLLVDRERTLLPILPLLFALGVRAYQLGPFFPNGATLVGFAFFGYYALTRIVWNEPVPVRGRTHWLVLAAVGIQAVSILVSIHVHGQHTWNAIRDGSSVFLFFPFAFILPDLLRTERHLRSLLRGLLVALLATGLVGVVSYMGTAGFSRVDIAVGYVYRLRVGSLFGAPNVLGGYLDLTLPLVLAMALTEKNRKWRLLACIAFALGFLSSLYTFSRATFILSTVGSGLVIVYRFRRKLWVPIVALLGFGFFMARNADTFARQLSLVTEPEELYMQPTLLHRYVTYRSFINDFESHPVSGRGWGALEFYHGRSSLYSFWDVRHTVSTTQINSFGGLNSLVLNHAVKGGLIALCALLMLLAATGSAMVSALRLRKDLIAFAVSAGILAFLAHHLVDNLIRWAQLNAFFWISLGLLVTMARPFPSSSGGEPAE
jgi:hypothetical protein